MRSVRSALGYTAIMQSGVHNKVQTYQGQLAVTAGILGKSTQSDCGLVFGVKLGEM